MIFFFFFFFFFPKKKGFDISCELSSMKTICMKCQILFSGNNKKTEDNLHEIPKPIFWEKEEKYHEIPSAEIFSQL